MVSVHPYRCPLTAFGGKPRWVRMGSVPGPRSLKLDGDDGGLVVGGLAVWSGAGGGPGLANTPGERPVFGHPPVPGPEVHSLEGCRASPAIGSSMERW